jgi:hypothetical protein
MSHIQQGNPAVHPAEKTTSLIAFFELSIAKLPSYELL